jgi:hypothetical protein
VLHFQRIQPVLLIVTNGGLYVVKTFLVFVANSLGTAVLQSIKYPRLRGLLGGYLSDRCCLVALVLFCGNIISGTSVHVCVFSVRVKIYRMCEENRRRCTDHHDEVACLNLLNNHDCIEKCKDWKAICDAGIDSLCDQEPPRCRGHKMMWYDYILTIISIIMILCILWGVLFSIGAVCCCPGAFHADADR